MDERLEKLLAEKPSSEEIEKAILKAKLEPPTPDTIAQHAFDSLKELYSEENPYQDPPNVYGGPAFRWSIDKSDRIGHFKGVLRELNRQDLLDEFDKFVEDFNQQKELKENSKIIENLLSNGINFTKIKDPEVQKYILYLEKKFNK